MGVADTEPSACTVAGPVPDRAADAPIRPRPPRRPDDAALACAGGGLNFGENRAVEGARRLGDGKAPPWHCATMLMLALLFALLVVLAVMIITRRWTGRLASLATLIAGAIMALWLAQVGLLPGSTGPLTPDRPHVPGLDR